MDPPIESSADARPPLFDRRYQIETLIGSGASATVYRAIDCELNRTPVALKVFHGLAGGQDAKIAREAKLLFSISHPHIVRALGFGRAALAEGEEQIPYIVLELLEGQTLDLLIAERQVSSEDAARYLSQLALAIEELHRHDILHRDIKPSNILITSEKQLKLLDFGVARSLAPRAEGHSTLHEAGTIAYLAPELARGGTATKAADVYGWGLIAIELFRGSEINTPSPTLLPRNPLSTLKQVSRALPPALERAVKTALAAEPEDRYRDGPALVAALAAYAKESRILRTARKVRHSILLRAKTFWTAVLILLIVLRLFFAETPAGWILRDLGGVHGTFHLALMSGSKISVSKLMQLSGHTTTCELLETMILDGDDTAVRFILEESDPDCTDAFENELLRKATTAKRSGMVRLLLDHGFRPFSAVPPLGLALQNRDLATAQLYWQHGYRHYCIGSIGSLKKMCDPEFVREMFRAGASPMDPVWCEPGKEPGFVRMLEGLMIHSCDESVEVALQHRDVRPDYRTNGGQLNLLSWATYQPKPRLIRLMVDAGFLPDLDPKLATTTLMSAIRSPVMSRQMLRDLLRAKQIADTKREGDMAIIHQAVGVSWLDGIAVLAMDPRFRDAVDRVGRTALHHAVILSSRLSSSRALRDFEHAIPDDELVAGEIITLLITAGLSPSTRDLEGNTAADYAESEHCSFCMELLESARRSGIQ